MIDIDRVRNLRDLRLFAMVMAATCFIVIAIGWSIAEDVLIGLFCTYFFLRALEYSERLRRMELDADELPIRERRRSRTSRSS